MVGSLPNCNSLTSYSSNRNSHTSRSQAAVGLETQSINKPGRLSARPYFAYTARPDGRRLIPSSTCANRGSRSRRLLGFRFTGVSGCKAPVANSQVALHEPDKFLQLFWQSLDLKGRNSKCDISFDHSWTRDVPIEIPTAIAGFRIGAFRPSCWRTEAGTQDHASYLEDDTYLKFTDLRFWRRR